MLEGIYHSIKTRVWPLLCGSHVLIIAWHLIFDTEAAFWPAFIAFGFPLPAYVAGLRREIIITGDFPSLREQAHLSGSIAFLRPLHHLVA